MKVIWVATYILNIVDGVYLPILPYPFWTWLVLPLQGLWSVLQSHKNCHSQAGKETAASLPTGTGTGGTDPSWAGENLWLLASLVGSFPFQSFQVGWINIVCASFLTWCHPPSIYFFFWWILRKTVPFQFQGARQFCEKHPCVTAGTSMTWVSIWPGHLIGSLCFVNGNKTPSCLQSLLWVFVSLCVCYSMFSSSGLLVHINLYQLHFVLYSHHFLPTYCVILPQECCLLLKVVRRTWNNHLHVIQHDSSWKKSWGLLRHTDEDSRRVAIFRQERETKVPILDAEFDWSCNWMIWILVRFQWERRLGVGL